MPKRVLIIASGETERKALPLLLKNLESENIVTCVRIPPRNGKIRIDAVCKIVLASQHDFPGGPPDKYVILVDTDGQTPEYAVNQVQQGLQLTHMQRNFKNIKYAYAQWHLEAWFFADARNLSVYLDRNIGNVNPNTPDQIENPKLHLKQLLGHTYTSRDSAEIAGALCPRIIAQRSPSFRNFLEAIRNGDAAATRD